MAAARIHKHVNGGISKTPTCTFDAATAGNLLVALIAWSHTIDMTTTPLGWTLVPTDGDVSNATDNGVRHMLFYKVAAGGESSITCTLASGKAWAVIVAEYRGLVTSGVLDRSAHDSGTNSTVTSGTTAVTTQANEVWIAAISDSQQAAVKNPTNGFVEIFHRTTEQEGRGDVTATLFDVVKSATAAASMSATTEAGSPTNFIGTIATFSADGAASKTIAAAATGRGSSTAQMLYPTLTKKVEAAFGAGPFVVDPTWTDITSYVRDLQWSRGRQNELNQPETGTASMVLADPSSAFDSRNTASPFYPNVKPGMQVRAWIGIGTSVYFLFRMVTEREPRSLRVTHAYTERAWSLVDAFSFLAQAGLASYGYADELSGTRINNVLDDIGWPADLREIDAGESTIAAQAFDQTDDTKALQHLIQVADSENGLLFVNGAGSIVFIDRHSLISDAAHTTPTTVLSDV